MLDRLAPKQVASRFGELKHGSTQIFMQFDDKKTGGVWRPEIVEDELACYRLYAPAWPSAKAWRRR